MYIVTSQDQTTALLGNTNEGGNNGSAWEDQRGREEIIKTPE